MLWDMKRFLDDRNETLDARLLLFRFYDFLNTEVFSEIERKDIGRKTK